MLLQPTAHDSVHEVENSTNIHWFRFCNPKLLIFPSKNSIESISFWQSFKNIDEIKDKLK